jgi:RNA polymerase sigma factor (sigma-70 family)
MAQTTSTIRISKSPDDVEILNSLKQRDDHAVSYIYEAYWPMILHFVLVNNGTEADAKDLYQEAMIDFIEKVWGGKLVLTCKIKTFIYSICKNKWRNLLRGKKAVIDIDDYIEIEKLSEAEVGDNNFLPNSKQIQEAIVSLGEPCRSLLVGFYYKKLTMEQLAGQFKYKSGKVVKQQKFRCKDRLKQALASFIKNDWQ